MQNHCEFQSRILCMMLLVLAGALTGFAGVSRTIQDQYKREYENRALFLRVPVYSEQLVIQVGSQSARLDQSAGTPRFKVGDQLRILAIDFAGDEIRFRTSGISTAGLVEVIFQFEGNLQEDFPNREAFNRAIQYTFTEGLKYTEIEDAKRGFVEEQFERYIKEISGSAAISRESVLKSVAPQVPAYRDAQREIDHLKSRLNDISGQLAQSQSDNRKLESELKAQQTELSRLKSAYTALENKMNDSASQISKLGDELRDAKGSAQGYQRELANIQRSLNLKVDSGRDLASQISDLGQVLRRLQKDNESLTNQAQTLRSNLDSQQAVNARLLGDNEELKANNARMQSTISTLTSKEDSLARQYLNLKGEKEKLDDFSNAVSALQARIKEEKSESGFHQGKANIYLRSALLGSLSWNIPMYLNHNERKNGEAKFSAESIDKVRLSAEERLLLRTLGNRLKVRIDLTSDSDTIEVKTATAKSIHEVGERDQSSWQWSIKNQGAQDSKLLLTAHLINANSGEIPILQQEKPILASNAIRQIRSYLQPISLVAGILLGFLFFGIVGIFRRPKSTKRTIPESVNTHHHIGRKQL